MGNKVFSFYDGTKRKKISTIYLEFAEYLNTLGVLSLLQENNLSGQDLSLVLGTKATNPSKPNQHLEAGKIYLGYDRTLTTRGEDFKWKVFYVNPIDWMNMRRGEDMGVFYIDLNRLQEWRKKDTSSKDFFSNYGGWQQAKDEIGLVTSEGNYKTLFGNGTRTFWEIPIPSTLGVFNWSWVI